MAKIVAGIIVAIGIAITIGTVNQRAEPRFVGQLCRQGEALSEPLS